MVDFACRFSAFSDVDQPAWPRTFGDVARLFHFQTLIPLCRHPARRDFPSFNEKPLTNIAYAKSFCQTKAFSRMGQLADVIHQGEKDLRDCPLKLCKLVAPAPAHCASVNGHLLQNQTPTSEARKDFALRAACTSPPCKWALTKKRAAIKQPNCN
jgi:hypothetical protein